MGNLDEFLGGNEEQPEATVEPAETPETPTEPEATPEPVAEEPKGPQRDEKGRFAPKGETEGASPAPQDTPLDHAALIGERRRRQEAEARIEALEKQFATFQKPPEAPQPPVPDFWEDTDGHLAHRFKSEREALLAEVREQVKAELTVEKFTDSAAAAREKYSDYDTTIEHFHTMAQSNPMLQQQVMMARNPAEFAYSTAKTALEVTQYGSIESMVNARVEEALKARQPAAEPSPIPDTLADAQSARGSTEAYAAPTLDSILKR